MLDIYKTFYGFKGEPFRLSPDQDFCFVHPSYANARAYLKYAISQGEGCILITGAAGSGKTTLIRQLFSELKDERFQIGMLIGVQLDPENFLTMVLNAFGLRLDPTAEASPLLRLERFLYEQGKNGRQTVLIVDEAQGLSTGSLEGLRLLSNIQQGNRMLLQVFLVGQEQLLETVHAPGMEQLRQRLLAAARLEPLDLDETVGYVEHRLTRVGWQGTPTISEGALRAIHRFSTGLPRTINLICSRLLILGGLEQKRELSDADASQVIEELQEEGLLGPEPPLAAAAYEDVEAQADAAAIPVRSLPRQSPVSGEQSARSVSNTDDSDRATTDISTRIQSVLTCPGDNGDPASVPDQNQSETGTLREDALSDAKIDDTDSRASLAVEVQKDKFLDRDAAESTTRKTIGARRWSGVTAFGLLAILGLSASLDTQIYDEMLGFVLSSFERINTAIHRTEQETGTGSDVVVTQEPPEPMATIDFSERETARNEITPTPGDDPAVRSPFQGDSQATNPEMDSATLEEPVVSGVDAMTLQAEIDPESMRLREEAEQWFTDDVKRVDENAGAVVASAENETTRSEATVSTAVLGIRVAPQAENESSEKTEGKGQSAVTIVARVSSDSSSSSTPLGIASEKEGKPVQSWQESAPAMIAKASGGETTTPAPGRDRVMSLLLANNWRSQQGEAAMLLPSESTYCKRSAERVNCWSVPKYTATKYGPARYKVESTLEGFSAEGGFRIVYSTLMKRANAGTRHAADEISKDGSSGATQNAMDCRLIEAGRVQCRDEQQVPRDYHAVGPVAGR